MNNRPDRDEVEDLVEKARKLTAEPGFRIGLVIGALVTVAIGIFIFQNGDDTDLEFLWADFNVPLWIGLLAAFVAGCVAAPIFGWSWRRHRRHKQERKEAAKAIKDTERQLS